MSGPAIRIAKIFAKGLRAELNAAQFCEMLRRNEAEPNPSVCHSHDFIDANVVMGEAFEQVLGRGMDVSSEADAEHWNDAWEIAKLVRFAFPANHGAA